MFDTIFKNLSNIDSEKKSSTYVYRCLQAVPNEKKKF